VKLTDRAAPLNDPAYQPKHPPVDGWVPSVVSRWSARSQLRWFRRFWGTIDTRTVRDWGVYYVESLSHAGPCCGSCWDDQEYGSGVDDRCCCHAPEPGYPE
jgi:hypothetical protein